MEFEWDDNKAASNLQMHGCRSPRRRQRSPTPWLRSSPTWTTPARRSEILVGYSERNRLLVISFTERPPNIRITSAHALPARPSGANTKITRWEGLGRE